VLLAPIAAAAGPHQQLAEAILRALARALTRLTSLSVLTTREVEARLGQVMAQQLNGCDADSCAADVANALGVDLIIQGRLDQAGGLWLLQLSVLRRATAAVEFRRQLRARSADGLLDSLDPLVREMFGGGVLMLQDPGLANRLGTNAAGVERLKASMGPHEDANAAWTRTIIEANKESDALALTEGALLGLTGLVLLLATPVVGTVAVAAAYTQLQDNPVYLNPAQTNLTGPYVLTYFYIATQLLFAGLGVLVLLPAGLALVLGVVDWLDLGRIPVARDGCCRDEEALRAASAPGWGRKVAPYLAAAGGVGTLLFTMGNVLVAFVAGIFLYPFLQGGPHLPGVSLDITTWTAAYFGMVALGTLGQVGLILLAGGALAGALLLIHSEYNSVVDQ